MGVNKTKIGSDFFDSFKAYLRQLGVSEEEIAQVKESQAESIFNKADVADGKKDGQADGETFLAAIKEEFAGQTINLEAAEQEYLDAWEELAGEDKILEAKEIYGEEEDLEGNMASAAPPRQTSDTTQTDTDEVKPVTKESLEGKDAGTLRNERSNVLSQIDATRSEMDAAKEAKQTEVDQKKQAYDDALKELAEKSELKDENDKTLKDLEEDKTNQENLISTKESEIKKVKSDISTKEQEITTLKAELSALKEPTKPTGDDPDGSKQAAYNKALAEYKEKKADLEAKIAAAEDELAQLELDLAQKENELKSLEDGLDGIETNIANLIIKIAESETENKELAEKVAEAMAAYLEAKEELAEIAKPFEEKLATLNANLETYESVIKERDAEEAKEKEKWTSDVESDEANKYKDQIDALLVSEETEDSDKVEKTEETDKTKEGEEAEETDKDKEESNKVLPEENKESLRATLEAAINDENVPLEDKFRLLSYAKGLNEDVVRDMLKDDTFFVHAFNKLAKDDKRSTDEVIAMQQVYFDLQGDREITDVTESNKDKIKEEYTEALVSLTEKAAKEGKIKDLKKHYEKNGISFNTIKDTIEASGLSSTDKANLLKRLEESAPKTNVATDKLEELGVKGDLDVTQNADGTFSAIEKGDGYEVSYTLDKDGNVTSYKNAIGTFTVKGNSVVLTPNTTGKNRFDKWAKPIDSYNINANIDDIIKSIKDSGPLAEKVINMDLNYYGSKERHYANNFWCVEYANDVLTQLGKPIGKLSDDVKANNQELSWDEAQTGDVYNKDRHVGIVLLNIVQRNGKRLVISGDHGSGKININIREWNDDEKRSSLSPKTRFFKGVSS